MSKGLGCDDGQDASPADVDCACVLSAAKSRRRGGQPRQAGARELGVPAEERWWLALGAVGDGGRSAVSSPELLLRTSICKFQLLGAFLRLFQVSTVAGDIRIVVCTIDTTTG